MRYALIPSQNGIKNGHFFPFDAKNRAKTAPRIPLSLERQRIK